MKRSERWLQFNSVTNNSGIEFLQRAYCAQESRQSSLQCHIAPSDIQQRFTAIQKLINFKTKLDAMSQDRIGMRFKQLRHSGKSHRLKWMLAR